LPHITVAVVGFFVSWLTVRIIGCASNWQRFYSAVFKVSKQMNDYRLLKSVYVESWLIGEKALEDEIDYGVFLDLSIKR